MWMRKSFIATFQFSTSYIFIIKLQIKILSKFKVYLKLINGYISRLFVSLETWSFCTENSLSLFTRKLWITQYIFLPRKKKSISDLSENLSSKLIRRDCGISCRRVESANVGKFFADFEPRGREYPRSISFDYKALENAKTFLTAVKRTPRRVHFTRQSVRSSESLSKKKKRRWILIFRILFFRRLTKRDFFLQRSRFFPSQKRFWFLVREIFYKRRESSLEI